MANEWQKELDLIVRILEAWHKHDSKVASNRADDARHAYLPEFNPGLARSQKSQFSADVVNGRLGKDPHTIGGFIPVAAVAVGSPTLFPVLTVGVHLRDGAITMHLRVVTFYVENGKVDAHGWRFDMPDPPPDEGKSPKAGHHSFPHVQRITGWLPSIATFHVPGLNPDEVAADYGPNMNAPMLNEKRPAFPLPVTSAAGMLVAAMASLYGSTTTAEILDHVDRRPPDFRSEAKQILKFG